MIRKKGSHYVVTTRSGKQISKPKTKKKALAQLGAIEASKARRSRGG